jgi:hypothetical protein
MKPALFSAASNDLVVGAACAEKFATIASRARFAAGEIATSDRENIMNNDPTASTQARPSLISDELIRFMLASWTTTQIHFSGTDIESNASNAMRKCLAGQWTVEDVAHWQCYQP